MKKILIWSLAAVLTFGVFVTPAQAAAPSVPNAQITERNGRYPYRYPNYGRPPRPNPGPGHRPPPPRPPQHHRPSHNHSSGSKWAALGIGVAVGSILGAAIANR